MRKPERPSMYVISAALTLLLGAGPVAAANQSIGDFEAAQQAAWNAHDAAAYAAAFDPEANVITALGWRWSGQAEAARNLADGFKLVYARALLQTSDIEVRGLTPELASVTLRWTIAGARTIEGAPQSGEQQGYQTQLLQRRGAGWVILAQQDTAAASLPPISQPAASSGTATMSASPQAFPTIPPPVRRCVLARGNGECLIYGKAKPAPVR